MGIMCKMLTRPSPAPVDSHAAHIFSAQRSINLVLQYILQHYKNKLKNPGNIFRQREQCVTAKCTAKVVGTSQSHLSVSFHWVTRCQSVKHYSFCFGTKIKQQLKSPLCVYVESSDVL